MYCSAPGSVLDWPPSEEEPVGAVREEDDLYTVDELAAATGTTVRTTRYYAGLGLIPPPIR